MDAQLKKGALELCILGLLSKEAMYGYDVMRQMHAYFPEVGESTFYAILRRLEKQGDAALFFGDTSEGPPRKYYKLTKKGEASLAQRRKDWHRLSRAVKELGNDTEDVPSKEQGLEKHG